MPGFWCQDIVRQSYSVPRTKVPLRQGFDTRLLSGSFTTFHAPKVWLQVSVLMSGYCKTCTVFSAQETRLQASVLM